MAEDNKQTNIWQKLGLKGLDPKKLAPLALVLVLGCVLMWISGLNPNTKEQAVMADKTPMDQAITTGAEPSGSNITTGESNNLRSQESLLEAKLVRILSKVDGVGDVDVSLTFAEGNKVEYAVNASTTMRSTEEADSGGGRKTTTETTENGEMVLEEGSNSPVLIQETTAKIQGVIVVADGGDDPKVCTRITEAVASLLDVPLHKIIICPSGKE